MELESIKKAGKSCPGCGATLYLDGNCFGESERPATRFVCKQGCRITESPSAYDTMVYVQQRQLNALDRMERIQKSAELRDEAITDMGQRIVKARESHGLPTAQGPDDLALRIMRLRGYKV